MPSCVVFIDLETTGPDPEADGIIEYAAVRLRDGRVEEEFAQLANPGCSLPLAVSRATGLTDKALRARPPSHQVLAEFLRFLGDDRVVAHDAQRAREFLVAKSDGAFRSECLDTLELARILYPTLDYHDLDTLSDHLSLSAEERPRAAGRVRQLVELWHALHKRLDELPFEVVAALSAVAGRTRWPARHLFLEAEAKRLTSALDLQTPRFRRLLGDFGPLLDEARAARRDRSVDQVENRPPPSRLNAHELTGLFEPDAVFAGQFPDYEVRPQQVRMVELVAEAFNEGHHALLEAGTGVGKSMAYLVPAVHWAVTNEDKIVVSTNTKNLQEQLAYKDIPLLADILGLEFQAALIKGRRNYLCVRKFLYLLEEGEDELSDEEAVALLPVIVWAAETEVGDVAECTGFLAFRQRELWGKLCSASEECAGPVCKRRRNCFLNRARAQSILADLIVANHAVVFAELGMEESVVLPDYAHLVFDEAHNLEDVATDYLGAELTGWSVRRLTRRLLRRGRGGRERGLLPSIRHRMKRGREEHLTASELNLDHFIETIYPDVSNVNDAFDAFLDAVGGLFGSSSRSADSLRYQAATRDPHAWQPVQDEKKQLIAAIGRLRAHADNIAERLEDLGERDFPYRTESMYDLRGVRDALAELEDTVEFLVAGDEEGFVYWIERYRRRGRVRHRMAAAPIRIGPRMKELLYDRKDTIIFTSATLSVAGKFDFLKDRIGLDEMPADRLLAEDVGSPFDYGRQMLICVPNFIQEPGRDADDVFTTEVAQLLEAVFRASDGRGLGLFTSYAMLNQVYTRLKAALEPERILVLGQGLDGERRSITRMFRRDTHSVLLGTASFREGVDVPGEALSCLAIVRLPFAVHTDPVVQARCEEVESRGHSAFMHYSLPSAVIRFKQGAGRLIRTRNDCGVLVVLDRRVLTRRYGAQFLRSLPTRHRACANVRHLCDMVRAFLGARREPDAPPPMP
jgi:ATP-dependent DNA helicase DinG